MPHKLQNQVVHLRVPEKKKKKKNQQNSDGSVLAPPPPQAGEATSCGRCEPAVRANWIKEPTAKLHMTEAAEDQNASSEQLGSSKTCSQT